MVGRCRQLGQRFFQPQETDMNTPRTQAIALPQHGAKGILSTNKVIRNT